MKVVADFRERHYPTQFFMLILNMGSLSVHDLPLLSHGLFSVNCAIEFRQKPVKMPKIGLNVSRKGCVQETYCKREK